MTSNTIRSLVIETLLKWKNDDIGKREVHEMAEELLKRLDDESVCPNTVEEEALVQLDALPQQWITVDDLFAILKLLKTPYGGESKGLAEWGEYWESINFRKHADKIAYTPYYSRLGPYA